MQAYDQDAGILAKNQVKAATLERNSLAGMLHPHIHQFLILYNGPTHKNISKNMNRNVPYILMFCCCCCSLSSLSTKGSMVFMLFNALFQCSSSQCTTCSFTLFSWVSQSALTLCYKIVTKCLLLFLPNLTLLSLVYLFSSLNSFLSLVFLYPFL